MSDVFGFGLAIVVLSGVGLLAVLSNRLVPKPESINPGAAGSKPRGHRDGTFSLTPGPRVIVGSGNVGFETEPVSVVSVASMVEAVFGVGDCGIFAVAG